MFLMRPFSAKLTTACMPTLTLINLDVSYMGRSAFRTWGRGPIAGPLFLSLYGRHLAEKLVS